MLNFDVKRKINTLRDILVGKVPDPKAQVEQITIALIYKFMDDMDLAAAEFGGKRTFFAGDYEKYAFTRIMSHEHSAQDKLNLYAEGIDKMVSNPELPQLFRDILRGAYIPYRDPETLNRFLKEIAEFSYDNSEDLGNAFEYLLSIMGSQGDAGQFRTPRHIIDMMVEIVAPRKDETILDPACGTAGFLISAYKYIDLQNRDEEGKSTLSGDDKKRMAQNFAGYDISPDMVRLSRVNMYLHGFSNPQISEYDTLTSLEKWNDNYDVILANPPFMTPKGGISPHNRYRVSAKRAEVLFVDYIAEHLNPTGRAAIVVPEGIVFQSQTAYKNLRRYLVEDNLLYAVVSLPAGVFNPYSGVKTSILLIDRTIAKERDNILFVKLNNDGYDLGAQRREIKGSEIPKVISVIKDYQSGEQIDECADVLLASKTAIAKQDYILIGERYRQQKQKETSWPTAKIGEICSEIKSGFACGSSAKDMNGVLHIRPMNISTNGRFVSEGSKFISADNLQADYMVKRGDVLFNNTNSKELVGKTCFVSEDLQAGFSNHITRIRVKEQVHPQYLAYLLQHMFKNGIFLRLCNKWVGQAAINVKTLSSLTVPLPPLSIQESIVEEVERYQKIIDGAQKVIQNYIPTISVNPEWEKHRLGDICEIQVGGTPSRDNELLWDSADYPWYTSGELNNVYTTNPVKYISQKGLEMSSARLFPAGSLLIGMYDTAAFKMSILDRDATFNQAVCGVKPSEKIDMLFLLLYFTGNRDQYLKMRVGARQRNLTKQLISNLEVPVPPIELQHKIVEEIKSELEIVNNNKILIEIFEKKIQNKIAEIWGE